MDAETKKKIEPRGIFWNFIHLRECTNYSGRRWKQIEENGKRNEIQKNAIFRHISYFRAQWKLFRFLRQLEIIRGV